MKPSLLIRYFILVLLIIGDSAIMTGNEQVYTELQVKKAEKSLNGLHADINKINTLLNLSDWYQKSYENPTTLEKAFIYAKDALLLSESLHSDIYAGKCYLQLSMLHQLRNNNSMIEVCARKAIDFLNKTNQIDDLGEAWVMVWSAKMRTNAPISERMTPIYKAASIFKRSKNNKRIGDCYKEISELYFARSDFFNSMNALKRAVYYYRAAHLNEKDIYPISLRLSILLEADRKNKDIIKLKNETFAQQNKLKSEAFLRNSMIISLVLLLIILGLLYKSFVFKKKTNLVLETQQNEIHQKNNTLQNLVIEKEWLLREIHHRVKNNLHMVVGLLASQAEFLKNEEAIKAINESQNRIQSMSLIHQKLYQSENLSMLHMPSYIFELTEYLKDSFDTGQSIRFILDIDNFDLPLSHSIPIGLIFNEAITNSIKYAFPNGKTKEIKISLKSDSDKRIVLTIHDNGIGLPKDFDPYNNPSLGIQLMHGLSEDIKGLFTIENDNGTKMILVFSMNEQLINT
ncbi:sensor histidine kinase [Flavobacterium artemisiae]|uniref:histidine kinase n=1 Tax=Flavobacterium artemisiae TaxID=2126556 RepID=A0ABW4HGR9_9FLAO